MSSRSGFMSTYSGSGVHSDRFNGTGYSSSHKSSLYDKFYQNEFTSISSRSSRSPSYSRYNYSHVQSSGYGKQYGSSNSDIVRPAIRSRQSSVSRENRNRTRESSLSRNFTTSKYNGSDNFDRPMRKPTSYHQEQTELPYSPSHRGAGRTSPVGREKDYFEKTHTPTEYRNGHPSSDLTSYPRPKFHTITSDYSKSRRDTTNSPGRINTTTSHRTSTTITNGGLSPVKTKNSESSSPHKGTYAASFAQNRTNNNNRKESEEDYSNHSSGSSRKSTGLQNGIEASPISRETIGSSATHHRAGLIGLRNIGNTCFMNSILQCLSNTKPLREYCLSKDYMNDMERSSQGKLVEAFSNVIEQIWRPQSETPIATNSFKTKIQKFSNRFSGYEQQDSQEFLRFLIEGLHEDVNRVTKKEKRSIPNFDSLGEESKAKKTWEFYLSKDNSFIIDLFMGQLKSSLKCIECDHISTTFDPFWDLSLPMLKNRGYSTSSISLESCLDRFTREETLEDDERPTCEQCKRRQKMTKKFTIYRFPKILVIHLKRFNEGSRYRQKLSTEVEFPHRLEISSPVSTSPASYNLYAVSNHSGSCYSGHYTAYCKNSNDGRWHSFNDSLVSSMSSSSVQSKEAYVLFYELVPSSQRSNL